MAIVPLLVNVAGSVLGGLATAALIPAFKEHFISAKLYGVDMNKSSREPV